MPPKGVICKSSFIPHARENQNYSIVEDLAQEPSAMLALEVFQIFPTQQKELLKDIGGINPTNMNLIIFDLDDHIPRLPHQLAFQIQVIVKTKNICRTFVDEEVSTCIMSITCWKYICSPALTESHNTLKYFNGVWYKPYGVLPALSILLEWKLVTVEVEVFDAPLDYNVSLGHSWIDTMHIVVSTIFHVIHFPHQGKVVTVDKLAFFNSDSHTSNVPFIAKTPHGYKNVGVGLLKDSSLMATFPIPPPVGPPPVVSSINMISTSVGEIPKSYNPWIIPSLEECPHYGDQMPLSPVELAYQAIQSTSPSPHSPFDTYPDPFHMIFHTDETMMEVMSMEDTPWDDGNHHSIIFLEPETIESYWQILNLSTFINLPSDFESTRDVLYEGKLGNISPTIPLDISIKPGIVENVHIGASCSPDEIQTYKALFQEFHDLFAWSYEEMPGIDPDIIVHEIKTYPETKPIRQRLRPIHPWKSIAIKLEVEKLLKFVFVYPVAFTEWVSNLVPVMKKQGMICVCVDYRDINKYFPKDNYPTPFIDDCGRSEIFSLMDGFFSNNQINILHADQHKTTFLCHSGTIP
jgi:hypothetical protein